MTKLIEIAKQFDQYIVNFEKLSLMLKKNSPVFNHPETRSYFTQNIFGVIDFLEQIFGYENKFSEAIMNTQQNSSGMSDINGIIIAAKQAYHLSLKIGKNHEEKTHNNLYVSIGRIIELKNVKNDKFDLKRLIRLCEELNIAYQNKSYMAVAMIVRSIIDHIPPIFGLKHFSEVANNYGGGSTSFKDTAKHLENSLRKIADSHLHVRIRKKESLPTDVQVDFKADLDMVLSEILRII